MQIPAVIPRPHMAPLQVAIVKAAAKRAALPFVVSRAGLLIVTMIASGGLPDLTRWRFWDGAFYSSIAAGGYAGPGWYAWFPLWPLIERISARPFAATSPYMPTFYAGFLLANVLCFVACTALEVCAPVRPNSLPISALLLASPFAFFLAAPYTESLFLLLAVGVFLALRHGWLGWAVALCALATATRPTGVALVLPILIIWLQTRGLSWRVLPVVITSCAGLLVYTAYCLFRTGDVLAFAHAETVYDGHALLWPWQAGGVILRAGISVPLIADGVAILVTGAVLIAGIGRLPLGQAAYAIVAVLPALAMFLPGTSDPLVSGGRYMLAAFPAFLLLHRASQGRPRLTAVLIAASVLAQSGLTLFELRHGWLP